MRYLIDGYNALFRLFHPKVPLKTSLEKRRKELLYFLNERAKVLHLSLVVVFDHHHNEDAAQIGHLDELTIIYTTKKCSADDYLINCVTEDQTPKQMTIVTSDREVLGRAKQLGAHTLSVEEFVEMISKERKSQKRTKNSTEFQEDLYQESPYQKKRLLLLFENKLKKAKVPSKKPKRDRKVSRPVENGGKRIRHRNPERPF